MSNYYRDLRSGSAILIDKRNDHVVAIFEIQHYDNDFDKMRTACNKRWDEFDREDKEAPAEYREAYIRKELNNRLELINKKTERTEAVFSLKEHESKEAMFEACSIEWDRLEKKNKEQNKESR